MTTLRGRRRSTGAAAGLTAILIAFACATPACSDDDPDDPSGTGGSGGKATGGTPGTGGRATGGTAGGGGSTGGRAAGGTPGTGGKATGGSTGGTEGGPPDAGCQPPMKLVYPDPGCNLAPICGGPTFDACLVDVCACDGTTLGGCGDYTKPWKHTGPCNDGGPGDGGDAGPDASSN